MTDKQVEAHFDKETGRIEYREIDAEWKLTYSKPDKWVDAPSFQWESEEKRLAFFARVRKNKRDTKPLVTWSTGRK